MTELDYNAVLADFTYKPNFFFETYKREDRWWIHITMLVEDSRGEFSSWDALPSVKYDSFSPPRPLIRVDGHYPIWPCYENQKTMFLDWLMLVIVKMEHHEMNEWARYKGVLLNDPHKENK